MKTKRSKAQSLYSAQAFRFVLPGHDDNLSRKKYVKIEPAAATQLDVDEIIERAACFKRMANSGKSVAEISGVAAKAIGTLALLACAGDGKALWQLAEIVGDAADALNRIAETRPDAVKPFARQQVHWPMFRSTAPHLCDDDALLEKIELGKATGVQLDKFSKWKSDRAAVCAYRLIKHVESIRRREYPIITENRKEIRFIKLLPEFTKDSAPKWWSEAKKFLLASYPKPEEITELDAMVAAKTKRKFPSTRRVAILEKIRARFLHLAI